MSSDTTSFAACQAAPNRKNEESAPISVWFRIVGMRVFSNKASVKRW